MAANENNLMLLATAAFEGGNFAKAIGFCEMLIVEMPASLQAWLLKGRCEARIRLESEIPWPQSRASLERAGTIAHSDAEREQVAVAWVESASATIERLGEESSAARSLGGEYGETAGAAAVVSLAGAVAAGASKNRKGKIAGAAVALGGAAVASHYTNKSKVAYLNALSADMLRGTICAETTRYLETTSACAGPSISSLSGQMAALAPSILKDSASDARELGDKLVIDALEVGPIAAIAGKYELTRSRAPLGDWVAIYARHQLAEKAVSLVAAFLSAAQIPFDHEAAVHRISQKQGELMRQSRPYAMCCCCLFIIYWLAAAAFGQTDQMIGLSFLTMFLVGGYSCLQIEQTLGDDYPRFSSSVNKDSAKLVALQFFGMYTGWYPLRNLKTWTDRAAINGVLQEELDRKRG